MKLSISFKLFIILLNLMILSIMFVVPSIAYKINIFDIILRYWVTVNFVFSLLSLIKKNDKIINNISFYSNLLFYFIFFIFVSIIALIQKNTISLI